MSDDCEHPPDAIEDYPDESGAWLTHCAKCNTTFTLPPEDLP